MAASLQLEVTTPERMLVRETVSEVQVPGANGYLGILPEHAPLLSELGCGDLWYVTESGVKKHLSICNGYLEVQPDHVRVLADRAENAEEIDTNRAQEALRRAEERLLHPAPGIDVARALNAAARARARLEAARHLR
ncbi:MAG: F0F1 ATP synthase subunit epsilon [Bryobacteraceae bacterium]|nr:F0F1 ATP synthase subunit epsilon [Bryobacteraceae bacterium]